MNVWIITNEEGHYYTGDLYCGKAKFSPKRDDAIELDDLDLQIERSTTVFPEKIAVEKAS
jgi:hypothetical protein